MPEQNAVPLADLFKRKRAEGYSDDQILDIAAPVIGEQDLIARKKKEGYSSAQILDIIGSVPLETKPAIPTGADSGRFALGPTTMKPDSTIGWLGRKALSLIPAAGATIGGIVGGGAGLALGGSGSVPGAVAGAALGGGAGEAGRQLIARGVYGEESAPKTSGEAALGIAGQGAMGAASEALGFAPRVIAPILKKSALTSYTRAINPTKEFNKAVTAEVVPELIDRGVVAPTLPALERKAASRAASLGRRIGVAEQGAEAERVGIQPVIDTLDKFKQDNLYVKDTLKRVLNPETGEIIETQQLQPGAAPLKAVVDSLQKKLRGIASAQDADSDVSRQSLRSLRQWLDEQVSQAHGFAVTPKEQSVAQIRKRAADAIRRELNNAKPDIAAINNEYSFWKNVSDVVGSSNLRRVGQQTPMGQQIARAGALAVVGATGGYAHGGRDEALAFGIGFPVAQKLFTSTAWRTVSAVTKDRIANYLAKGWTVPAAHLMTRALQTAATKSTDQPSLAIGDEPKVTR